jgi:hypothetical protein
MDETPSADNTMIPRKGQKVKRSKSHKIQILEVGTGRGGGTKQLQFICPTVYRCVINIALNVGATGETPSADNTMIPQKGQKVKRSKSHKIQILEVGTGRGGVLKQLQFHLSNALPMCD